MIKSILNTVGNTPLIRLSKIETVFNIKAHIYAKLEYFNPFGSIKDRAALAIINNAIDKNLLLDKKGILDATSGNMGISLAAIAQLYNLECTIVMPENASEKRKNLLKIYGANVILTPMEGGINKSIMVAQEISKEENKYFFTNQFQNSISIDAHFSSTAPEIEQSLGVKPDVIISGIGTGGTIMGIANYYKSSHTQIFGVIPNKKSNIPGLRNNILNSLIDINALSGVVTVNDTNLQGTQNDLIQYEGIFAGYSSCANLVACIDQYQKYNWKDKNIVLIFADGGERYI